MDDITINKVATIEKCINRINEEYIGFEVDFFNNYSKQDSVILNIQRASQACIDLAMHIIRINQLGLPQNSRDVFAILAKKDIINTNTAKKLQQMVGFRNIAVHDYQQLNLKIIINIIDNHLQDFSDFSKEILNNIK